MPENSRKWTPMDAETRFCEDKVVIIDGSVQEAGADVVIAIGPGYKEFTWVVNVSALDQAPGDETVIIMLQGTNDPDFAIPGNVIELGRLTLGAAAPGGVDLLSGRYNTPASNERNGVNYKNLRLVIDVAGTTPSVTFDSWLSF